MTAENQNQPLPLPAFDEVDKAASKSDDATPSEREPAVTAAGVGEILPSDAELDLPEPAEAESAEGTEDELTFDHLMELDKKNLKILLGKLDKRVAATALAGLKADAQEKVLGALTKGVAAALREEIGRLGTVEDDAKAEAEDSIVEKAKELEEIGEISLNSLLDEEQASDAIPQDQPDAPKQPASKIERAKSPEERADAYATYFTGVKTHGEFLHKIARMTDDSTLRQVVGIAELARVAKKVYHKILAWHAQFEVMKGSAMPVELNTSLEEFAKKLPAAFAMVLRSVTHEEAIAPRIPGTSAIDPRQTKIDRLLGHTRTAGGAPTLRTAEAAPPAFSSTVPKEPQTPDEILAAFRAKYPAPAKPPSAPLPTAGPTPERPKTSDEILAVFRAKYPAPAEPSSAPPGTPSTEKVGESPTSAPPGTPPLNETAEPPTSASLPAAGPTPERPKTTDEILAAFRARHPAPAGLEKKTLKPMPLAVFEDLVKVDQPTLEKVLAAVGHPKLWGRVLGGLTEEPAMLEFAKEVRAFFARKDKAQANEFDAGVMYIESDASLKMLRRALLINARRALEEEHGTTAETGEKENEKK